MKCVCIYEQKTILCSGAGLTGVPQFDVGYSRYTRIYLRYNQIKSVNPSRSFQLLDVRDNPIPCDVITPDWVLRDPCDIDMNSKKSIVSSHEVKPDNTTALAGQSETETERPSQDVTTQGKPERDTTTAATTQRITSDIQHTTQNTGIQFNDVPMTRNIIPMNDKLSTDVEHTTQSSRFEVSDTKIAVITQKSVTEPDIKIKKERQDKTEKEKGSSISIYNSEIKPTESSTTTTTEHYFMVISKTWGGRKSLSDSNISEEDTGLVSQIKKSTVVVTAGIQGNGTDANLAVKVELYVPIISAVAVVILIVGIGLCLFRLILKRRRNAIWRDIRRNNTSLNTTTMELIPHMLPNWL